ncbi:mirror-image polydactyly gene 1 protein [Rhinatrema bivittatum]|uniref:mirror-image polydactyly gene 1 protein n=1 Tax=Rhinatrema bivittatum TaxID=194408 RepID=UPI00112B344A|nr:mirror-image polydactyly gene 1 protein [Rhinatrema bivittatum]
MYEENQPQLLKGVTTQKKEDMSPDDHLQSLAISSQHREEPVGPTDPDTAELPVWPIPSQRNESTICSKDVCPSYINIHGAAGKSSGNENQDSRLVYKYVIPSQVTSEPDQEKAVTLLLKELDILRENNKKLQDKLAEKDKELETLKLDLELQDRTLEAKIAEKTAALVEEVYLAQRERDEAVMARLRLANEERDEALLRAKRLQQSLLELENINPEENDMTLQELLSRVNKADTGIAIEKSGAVIVDRIYKTRECKEKITAEEMNAVIEQRDAALSQCKRLEQELHHLSEQNQTSANNTRHLTVENNPERARKAQMISLQQDRDKAIQQYKKLEEEIQTLRVYYSLHQSLSQEVILKEQFSSAIDTYEKALRNREDVLSITQHQNEELGRQLQQCLREQSSLQAKLQLTLQASQEAAEKVQKLERLVDVLRKKVGAGTLRTVI